MMAYKTITMGILQYSMSLLGMMTGKQRKKLEAFQRMVIGWIYRKAEGETNDAKEMTLWITIGTDEAAKQMEDNIEDEHKLTYKEKLKELGFLH